MSYKKLKGLSFESHLIRSDDGTNTFYIDERGWAESSPSLKTVTKWAKEINSRIPFDKIDTDWLQPEEHIEIMKDILNHKQWE